MHVYIGCLLIGLAMMVASCERLPRPAATPSQRGKGLMRLIKSNKTMKTTSIYTLLALLLMAGGVTMQAQEYPQDLDIIYRSDSVFVQHTIGIDDKAHRGQLVGIDGKNVTNSIFVHS